MRTTLQNFLQMFPSPILIPSLSLAGNIGTDKDTGEEVAGDRSQMV